MVGHNATKVNFGPGLATGKSIGPRNVFATRPILAYGMTVMNSSPASIGFKDWALICEALGQGRQSLILRKGGIAEGRDGFRFKHEEFFLFPTQYHQQAAKVRPEELATLRPAPAPAEGTVEIQYFFALEWAVWIEDWEALTRLEPFHVWREEVVRERFDYDEPRGLQCAFGRVYRLDPAWTFPDKPSYGGCRSWINLPELPPETRRTPVIDDARHRALASEIQAALGNATAAFAIDR
jgi:hypothetical protein